jgi:hypothetical protein
VSFGSRSSGKTGQLTNLNRAASDAPCVLDGSRKQNLYFWYALDGIITARFVKKKEYRRKAKPVLPNGLA